MFLLILLVQVQKSEEIPKAVLKLQPGGQIFSGEKVTLTCEIQDTNKDWMYNWFKNDDELFSAGENREYLFTATEQDSGSSYTCSGQSKIHSQNSEISNTVTLTVSAKPKPTVTGVPLSFIYTGDVVTLNCELQVQQSTEWTFNWCRITGNSLELATPNTNPLSVPTTNAGETEYQCIAHKGNYDSEFSDRNTITVKDRPQPVLNVSVQNWLTEGDSVTLSCEVRGSTTGWIFSWYKVIQYRGGFIRREDLVLLSNTSRGAGGSYTLSPAVLNHTGVYVCRAERGEPAYHTQYSQPQPLWITGESGPVSLIISPNRTQHFFSHSLSLSCKGQRDSTGWRVRRYRESKEVSDCLSDWESTPGSTCSISFLYLFHTGVYWCQSESGGSSNPVNITVHYGDVILESPVHPVTEGHSLTLHCLYRYTNHKTHQADFYKDGLVLKNQTEKMIIHSVSKSDEGFYHCKHPEEGESPKSWILVRGSGSGSSGLIIGIAVGLSLFSLFIILMILLCCYKTKKGKQQNTSERSDQTQSQSRDEDSQAGYTPLQAGTEHVYDDVKPKPNNDTENAAAGPSNAIYSQVIKKNKKTNKDVDAGPSDLTYIELDLKPNKKAKAKKKEDKDNEDETVYSMLKTN
ncbi:Fc receptor-like protein 5 isoform X2 [Trichomycterus rosablanca]|uniref:Fc receptor-like protein 5 isoform X2 n=1 Tax=Trichomycterus rosablanca TaxID=2290929 RepID=UPI002F358D86